MAILYGTTAEGESLPVEVNNLGQLVAEGLTGPQGPEGPAGPGIAPGGDAGQVLSKVDGSDYNTEWVTPSSGIEEAPNDGLYYVRHNGTWVRLAEALDVLQSATIDGGDFVTGVSNGTDDTIDGGVITD